MNKHQQIFNDLMAERGINDTHGLTLLRQIKQLSRMYDTVIATHMRADNLSGSRWRLLLYLFMAEKMGQASVNPTELSKARKVTKNTISSLLRSLEDQKLVTRTLHPTDRRQFNIQLTDSGRKLISDTMPGHINVLNQMSSDISAEEVEQLSTLLRKLHKSLVKHGDLSETYCDEEHPVEK